MDLKNKSQKELEQKINDLENLISKKEWVPPIYPKQNVFNAILIWH
ncbi:MAG: hypothetical protein U5K35_07295 [Rhodohalobacter sp.]|nr:hypothetical protein [Rhodohalobacter sp.]